MPVDKLGGGVNRIHMKNLHISLTVVTVSVATTLITCTSIASRPGSTYLPRPKPRGTAICDTYIDACGSGVCQEDINYNSWKIIPTGYQRCAKGGFLDPCNTGTCYTFYYTGGGCTNYNNQTTAPESWCDAEVLPPPPPH